MKKSLPTVTIGIPAYNEKYNLISIVSSVLNQKRTNYSLTKVLIILDGYTDQYSQYLYNNHSDFVEIIIGEERVGKSMRLNQIFDKSDTDIVVILDTDISFENSDTIDRLVEPFITNDFGMISGKALPKAPESFIEGVSISSVLIWEEIKKISHNPAFTAEGTIRAFSRKFYKQLVFPNKSADDIYSYIACIKQGFNYKNVPRAVIRYSVPSTISDFIHALRRYMSSQSIQEDEFGFSISRQYFFVPQSARIRGLIKILIKRPFTTTVYLLIWIIAKTSLYFTGYSKSSKWKLLMSTKENE